MNSWILPGDILLHKHCERIKEVKRKGKEISATYTIDNDSYATLLWDLTKTLSALWHTINIKNFPYTISKHNIYCISIPTIPIKLRENVDIFFKSINGYIGAIEFDVGNPLHRMLFIDDLCRNYYIQGKS